jgi:hypothetical protein
VEIRSKQVAGDQPQTVHSGTYLHQMAPGKQDSRPAAYSGQATGEWGVHRRVENDHKNKTYQAKNLNVGLHYLIWEDSDFENDHWIVFTSFAADEEQLILNLAEEWTGLVSRSLQRAELEAYLPPGAVVDKGIRPANVDSPMFQNQVNQKRTFGLHYLKDSQDPIARAKYDAHQAKFQAGAKDYQTNPIHAEKRMAASLKGQETKFLRRGNENPFVPKTTVAKPVVVKPVVVKPVVVKALPAWQIFDTCKYIAPLS